eukprot:TRINITY_DN1788_c0_g1_i1.p1 TRINITY_DN1788_c0_g1~~TRINITY_DN1788_c0_g1_i1.p1  ORF type:complete len:104 (+),score=39.68 TRINITY_DN1788_c0_g1_i1:253-564(+)
MMGVAPSQAEVNQEEMEQPTGPADAFPMSIGAKMMAAMGWKGGGLGKEETGRRDPVEVQVCLDKSGLGSQEEPVDEKFQVLPGDSYQQATKKRMQERFNKIAK